MRRIVEIFMNSNCNRLPHELVRANPLRLRALFGPPKPLQRTAYQEISNQMGTYFVYLDISNTAGNPVRGIGTLDREIRYRSVQIMDE